MNSNKDHVRHLPGRTTAIFIFFSFFAYLIQAQTSLPVSITNGSSNEYKVLNVGTVDVQGQNVEGIGVRFTGNFATYPPDSMSVSLSGSWFTPSAGDYDYYWVFASDSSYADFFIEDLLGNGYSGYGKFLEFYRAGGTGVLVVDDVLRTTGGLQVQSAWVLGANGEKWTVYPNPASPGETIQVQGIAAGQSVAIRSMDGKMVAKLEVRGGQLTLPQLQAGIYFAESTGADGVARQSRKLVVR